MSNPVEINVEKIANGYIVDLQLNPPMTKSWYHQELYCATLEEALIKARDVADSVATYSPNIKNILKLEAEL